MVKSWAVVLLLPALALAAVAPAPVIDHPIMDTAGLLSASEKEWVAGALLNLRATKGAQMALLLVDTTAGEPIEDYSMRVARQWRGGQGGANNGLLFVLAVKDRRMRLDVGYGLEEYLPDDAVRRLLDEQLPLMRQQNFAGALNRIIAGVDARLPASGDGMSTRAAAVAPVRGASRIPHEPVLLELCLLVLCALVLRPGRLSEGLGREGRVLLCVGVLVVSVGFTVYRTWGDSGLATSLSLALLLSAGVFFLGRMLLFDSDSSRIGCCLMVGAVVGLGSVLGRSTELFWARMLVFTFVGIVGLMLSSFMWWGNLILAPWMLVFGGGEIFKRWLSAVAGVSYSSSSTSSDSWSSSSTSSDSWSSWSSSSSSYDSSSSSSSDSSSSSSSSSDWGGGGGDFGGGGSSSSW